jgi:hypothetical protein
MSFPIKVVDRVELQKPNRAAGVQKPHAAILRFIGWLNRYGATSYDHQSFLSSDLGRSAKALYYRHPRIGTLTVAPIVFCEAFVPSARALFWRRQCFSIADAHYAIGFALLSRVLSNEQYFRRAVHTLRERIRELARERQWFGHLRLMVLLRRDDWVVNHNKVYRICREEQLLVPRRRRKRIRQVAYREQPALERANQSGAMDFMQDGFSRRANAPYPDDYRSLHTRALALEVDTSIPGVLRKIVYGSSCSGIPPILVMQATENWFGHHP